MAVGKGSLQRAANAAGRSTTVKTAGAAGSQAEEAAKKESSVAGQVNALEETMNLNDAQAKEMTEKQVQPEAGTEKKKKAKTAKRAKTESTDTAVKTADGTVSKKMTKKQTKATRSAGVQMTYLLTVPAEALQDIPQTWRGSKYVRPNVSALAESISKCGILEPIPAVQTGENTYQIVGGSKRMQVVQMLGIPQVPVLVLPGASMEDAWKLYQELNAAAEDGTVQRDWSAADEAQQISGQKQNKIGAQKTDEQDKVSEVKKTSCSLFGKQRIPEYLL